MYESRGKNPGHTAIYFQKYSLCLSFLQQPWMFEFTIGNNNNSLFINSQFQKISPPIIFKVKGIILPFIGGKIYHF